MPAIADLVGQDVADRLAAIAREAAQRQAEAASAPKRARKARDQAQPAAPVTAPVCESCGRPLPPPPVLFRSGAEQPGAALAGDPSRARA